MSKSDDREAILYAFAVEAKHDRATLERYLRKHPELAEELIDLSSELRLGEALGPAPEADDPGLEAAWQSFLACGPAEATCGDAAPAFAFPTGEAFAKLAASLNAPRSILTAIRDGLAVATSIPKGFIRRFAAAANTSAEAVRECFANPQPAMTALAFKSSEKPSHQGKKTFRELVESTPMTEEQRRLLLQDFEDDGLD